MKNVSKIVASLLFVCAMAMPSTAKADVALGVNFAFPDWNAGLHARVSSFFITTSYFFDNEAFGASVDYIVWSPKLSETISLSVAPGVFAGFNDPFSFGVELPSGVMWKPTSWIETYIQAIPNFLITPDTNFDIGGSAGFRFVL